MKFVMIGSGAVGSYFGARLMQAGHEVVFVARGKQLSALRETGLTLRSEDQEVVLRPVEATDDLAAARNADYALVSVKAWQVEAVAPALAGSQTYVLTLQNGVEAPGIVAAQVGEAQTFAGLVRGFFQMEAPGIVRHVGVQPSIIFGQINRERTPEAERLLRSLSVEGVHAELSDDIEAALWEKFLMVTSLSGMGAVTRAPIGDIRDYPPTCEMLRQIMIEIAQVARARGVRLPDDVVDRILQFVESFPHEATTSMQRDLINGLPSELEAQTGAVVRLGREASAATPINQFIYDSLILQEMRARSGS